MASENKPITCNSQNCGLKGKDKLFGNVAQYSNVTKRILVIITPGLNLVQNFMKIIYD